jgi:hypothetical protein
VVRQLSAVLNGNQTEMAEPDETAR